MKPCIAVLLLACPLLAQAGESPHVVALQYDIAAMDVDPQGVTKELNDVGSSHLTLSYQYHLTPEFSLVAGYMKGKSSDSDLVFVDAFTDSKLEYDAWIAGIRGSCWFSTRNAVYAQVNAVNYDYDVVGGGITQGSDSGTDMGASIGWKHQYSGGIGLKLGYDYLRLGDQVSMDSFSVELSYRF